MAEPYIFGTHSLITIQSILRYYSGVEPVENLFFFVEMN